ncbi:MAG TPA: hypothetical protein VG273_07325 [Bryobacteraceae bacterium]|jgi:hypothetical protein|nr:hypothetical protein [Bryobacteraceae bacterium]
MPEWWRDFARGPSLPELGLPAVICVICLAGGWLAVRRLAYRRISPEELEKRRRLSVNSNGKTGDGEIIDIDGSLVLYSYSVAGVGYTTSQDVGALLSLLPSDRLAIIGPVAVKYLPPNPANSIVLCEGWSGLRNRGPKQAEPV